MLPDQKYFPVNWVDGMKISKDHFIQADQAVQDQIRDVLATGLNEFNFGLLSQDDLDLDRDRKELRLENCRALTAGGVRIEISPQNQLTSALTASIQDLDPGTSEFDVVVAVRFYERVPAGTPEVDETPLRLPFSIPEYRLEIVPSIQSNQHFAAHLVIGKLFRNGEEFELADYIPPCTRVSAYDELVEYAKRQVADLEQAMDLGSKIVRKIKGLHKPKNTRLSGNISFIMEKLVFHLAGSLSEIKYLSESRPPAHLFCQVQNVARVLLTSMNCLHEATKDELNDYFSYYAHGDKGTFKRALQSFVSESFPQQNAILKSMIDPAEEFSAYLVRMLVELNGLDDYDWNVHTFTNRKAPPTPPPSHERTNNPQSNRGTIIRSKRKRQ